MSPLRPLLTIVFTWVIAPAALAQLPNATDTTATPAPGMHDYLGSPVETVNPANGSVSIRIPVRMAQGRQLTVPFSFAYDSNGAFFIAPGPTGGAPKYITIPTAVGSKGGWSYAYPVMSFSGGTWTIPGSLDHLIICHGSTNYVFQDQNGNRHNLGLSVSPDVASPDGFDNCNQGLQGDGEFTTGGEGPILATTSIPTINNGTVPAVVITDGDGTGYYLPGGNPGTTGLTTLATSVSDRNGNSLSITNASGAITYTDTLGRAALHTSGIGGNPDTITVAGLTAAYQVHWGTAAASFTDNMLNLCTGAGCQACPTSLSASSSVVSSIVLPNGTQFTLTYNATYGMLTKLLYPSGGYVRYVWGLNSRAEAGAWVTAGNIWDCRYDFPAITDRYVSFDGSTEVLHQQFLYSTSWPNNTSPTWTTKTTTVTTTDLLRNTSFTTVYTYSPFGTAFVPNCGSCYLTQQVPVEQSIQYNDVGGRTLKTASKSWGNVRLLKSAQTTLDNNQSSLTVYCYNSNEEATETDEYDLGTGSPSPAPCGSVPPGTVSGPLLRKTTIGYASFAAHIVDRPSTAISYDGSGNRVAETDSPSYDPNGNLLTQTKQCFALPGGQACPQGNSTTTYAYDSHGQPLTMVDPKNNTTSYSYSDSYNACGGSAPPTSPSDAYLTQVTFPQTNSVNHIVSYCYDYVRGLLLSSTDENNLITTYKYADSLDRITETDYPDTGKTTISYNDAPYNPSTPSPSVTITRAVTSTANVTSLAAFDGLGHTVRSVLTSDPDCATGDRTDTTYDGFGRVLTVSNPYCIAGESTSGLTTYTFDALGRTTQVSHPDNTTVLTTYTGRATQVQDEGNGAQRVARISQTDALGRLLSLCEVAPGPFVGAGGSSSSSLIGSSGAPVACGQDIAGTGFLTTYQYDTLSNLLQVNQTGIAPRTFAYDSLSRLLTASNPESGAINYAYDTNGNLLTKTAPAPNQTGTATVTTTYQYDALNRLTQKSYNDGTTPTATYAYDVGCNATYYHNQIGRLDASSVPGWSFCLGYDSMGRLADKDLSMSVPAGTLYLDYTYDLLGDITSQTAGYGSASYSYNTAGRPITVTSSYSDPNNPATVFSAAHYNAFGGLTSDTLGNNETETYSYVPHLTRLQSYTAKLNTTTNYNFNITSFAPNGDILAASDTANGNWTYTYDPFNRLVGANKNSGQAVYSYVYDRFGNRWQQNGPHPFLAVFTGNNPGTPQNNNRMDGYSYDAAGNLLNDGTHGYTYDAENRLVKVDNGTTATYAYDADGNRVQKTSTTGNGGDPAGTWQFLYDQSGHMIQRFDGTFWQGNIYVGGRHLVEDGAGTNFSHSDWLGTERVRSTNTGAVCESIASLPFGDGQTTTGACYHSSPLHFTGKERDPESGLDNFGARYDSSSLGRFMSPDPSNLSVDFYLPQTWNRYTYGLNNPLVVVDRNGLWPTYIHNEIINEAFPGLNRDQLQTLRQASYDTDYTNRINGHDPQDTEVSFVHGMSDGVNNQDPMQAQQQGDAFIAQNEHHAQQIQADWVAAGNTGIAPAALTAFGNALHTIEDRLSPAHTGNQPWYGTRGAKNKARALGHVYQESTINQAQRNATIAAARAAFLNTFGNEFELLAIQHRRACTTIQGPNGPETHCEN